MIFLGAPCGPGYPLQVLTSCVTLRLLRAFRFYPLRSGAVSLSICKQRLLEDMIDRYSIVPAEHVVGRANIKKISSFRRNVLCSLSVKPAQSVPLERKTTTTHFSTHNMFRCNNCLIDDARLSSIRLLCLILCQICSIPTLNFEQTNFEPAQCDCTLPNKEQNV